MSAGEAPAREPGCQIREPEGPDRQRRGLPDRGFPRRGGRGPAADSVGGALRRAAGRALAGFGGLGACPAPGSHS